MKVLPFHIIGALLLVSQGCSAKTRVTSVKPMGARTGEAKAVMSHFVTRPVLGKLSETERVAVEKARASASSDALEFFPTLDGAPTTPAARLWRLTPRQVERALTATLGQPVTVAELFGKPSKSLEFQNDSAMMTFDENFVRGLDASVDAALAQAKGKLAGLLPCGNAATADTACISGFVATFGEKVFRRPLSPSESARYRGLFESLRTKGTAEEALEATVGAFLRSPFFVARAEVGEAAPGSGKRVLTPFEIATALAFTAWNRPPDDALLAAARMGKLDTPEGRAHEVKRLLDAEYAVDGLVEFYNQWLGLGAMPVVEKSPEVHARFDAATRAALAEEARRFLVNNIKDHGSGFIPLLTERATWVPAALADIHGLKNVPAGGMSHLPPAEERAGVFTLPAVIAVHSPSNATGLVERGYFLLNKLLCKKFTIPPDVPAFPEVRPGLTVRQMFELHEAEPSCGACHRMMDPLGFAMENYDAVGRFRTQGPEGPIDSVADVKFTERVNGVYARGTDMIRAFATSPEVYQCMVRQAFRYANGRAETDSDAPALRKAYESFLMSGLSVRDLFAELMTAPGFYERKEGSAP